MIECEGDHKEIQKAALESTQRERSNRSSSVKLVQEPNDIFFMKQEAHIHHPIEHIHVRQQSALRFIFALGRSADLHLGGEERSE